MVLNSRGAGYCTDEILIVGEDAMTTSGAITVPVARSVRTIHGVVRSTPILTRARASRGPTSISAPLDEMSQACAEWIRLLNAGKINDPDARLTKVLGIIPLVNPETNFNDGSILFWSDHYNRWHFNDTQADKDRDILMGRA